MSLLPCVCPSRRPLYTFRHDTAAITNIRPWSPDAFWTTSVTGSACLWKLGGGGDDGGGQDAAGSAEIVAQMTGVDCEPIHDICVTSMYTYMASYNAVRVYALGALPQKSVTQSFHGLEIPARSVRAAATPAAV